MRPFILFVLLAIGANAFSAEEQQIDQSVEDFQQRAKQLSDRVNDSSDGSDYCQKLSQQMRAAKNRPQQYFTLQNQFEANCRR
jgi:uncharacterized protein YlxW (UPF0749 family)